MVPDAPALGQERRSARPGEQSPSTLPEKAPRSLPKQRATGAEPGREAALSVTGEQSCQTDPRHAASRRARTARWALRRQGLWRVSQLPRAWKCGRYLYDEDGTGVRLKEGAAYYDGLVTCGSIWSCPVCAARIRQRRAQEIEHAALTHMSAGGGIEFLTCTLAHIRTDPLAVTLEVVQQAWKRVQQNGTVRRLFELYGVFGRIRATEITRTGWNGWHPHLHVLLFGERPLTEDERALLLAALYKAWTSAVLKLGREKAPDERHGVTLREAKRAEIGNYLAKVQDQYGQETSIALEMARSDAKKGRKRSRTPFEILEGAADGLARDVRLWHEYEKATKGRRAIEWSRGLKARFAVVEVDDEDLAAADVDGERIAWVHAHQWRALIRSKQETAVLDAAEDTGAAGVHAVLATLSPPTPEGDPDE